MNKKIKDKKRVDIIVINSNGFNDTIDCIQSVLNNDYDNFRIVIVDNNSTDNSINEIIKWSDKKSSLGVYSYSDGIFEKNKTRNHPGTKTRNPIIVIRSDEVKGFAENNNIGMKFCLSDGKPEYFWLLNNDTVVVKDTLVRLIELSESDSSIGITGSKLIYFYNTDVVQTMGNDRVSWKGIGYGSYDGIKSNVILPDKIGMKSIVGASLLIKAEVVEKIGLMEECYFMTHEETAWCVRASRAGYQLFTSSNSVVYHKEGRSTDRRRTIKKFFWLKASRTTVVDFLIWGYYSFRNEIYFVRNHYGPKYLLYVLFYLPKKIFVKTVSIFIFNDDHKFIRLYLLIKAVFDGVTSRMGMTIDVRGWRKRFK
jgi:GT2 family glycosyltransferase